MKLQGPNFSLQYYRISIFTQKNEMQMQFHVDFEVSSLVLADIIFVFSLIHSDKPENYDVWYESRYEECDKEACLSFSKDILCSRVTVDHNYYAICQNLLSRFATWRGTTGGLLHDPPANVVKDGRLTTLLDECTRPQKLYGRFQAAKELREFLTQLTQLSNTNR